MTPDDLPRLDDLDDAEPDFVSLGTAAFCRHCGSIKEASARWFVGHYHACVKPRRGED